MKINDLVPEVEFGFTYNKFTFPLTFACVLLLIPIIYYPDLHSLGWIVGLMIIILYMPIHDKGSVVSKENKHNA